MKAEKKSGIIVLAIKLAQRPNGLTVNDLMAASGLLRQAAFRLLEELAAKGTLKRVKTGHRSVLYESIEKPKYQTVTTVASGKLDPSAPAIIPPGVKITICPTRWV